jgi:hexosaminidase
MRNLHWLLSATILASLFVAGCQSNKAQLAINIIPQPLEVEVQKGYFVLTPETKLVFVEVDSAIATTVDLFRKQISKSTGMLLQTISPNAHSGGQSIFFILDAAADSLGQEGYLIQIVRNSVLITAYQRTGLFRATQTIYQLLPTEIYDNTTHNITWQMPCVKIYDKPSFGWRGMHLDVSRHFFDVDFVKRYIDLIAMHKMNVFHWHLTDDNGWRIEIKKYPKLTDVGAWRVDRESQPWNERTPPQPGDSATYGGFYTQDQIREVVAYAAARHIMVVPEIEMPGHASAALAAYPDLACTDGPFYVMPGGYWPIEDIFCAGNEKTFEVLEGVLDEVIELFPSQYIHIGGDEATKTHWETCPKCQKRIRDEKLANTYELQSYFVKRIEKYLISKNKKLIGWDEILEGGLAPEATVMSWRGIDGGIQAAREGHDVVMCPVTHCYLDYYQANPDFEPNGIGGLTTLKRSYSFDPVPADLTAKEAKHILGGQGNVWTEYIATPEHAEYMAMPRMAALAEALWTAPQQKCWDNFRQRIETQFDRYDIMGINYSEGSYAVGFKTQYDSTNQQYTVEFTTEQLSPTIRYTTDGSEPTAKSMLYDKPLAIDSSVTLRAAIFSGDVMNETFSEKRIAFHQALGAKVKYTSPPSNQYPGQGATTLVDGLQGSIRHHDGFWQGFYGDDMAVEIDLGTTRTISNVTGSFMQYQALWIFMPETLEVSVSTDGVNYSEAGTVANTIDRKKDKGFGEELQVKFSEIPARYIRIKATNGGVCPAWHPGAGDTTWIFADEIIVR